MLAVPVLSRRQNPLFELPDGLELKSDLVYSSPGGRDLHPDLLLPKTGSGPFPRCSGRIGRQTFGLLGARGEVKAGATFQSGGGSGEVRQSESCQCRQFRLQIPGLHADDPTGPRPRRSGTSPPGPRRSFFCTDGATYQPAEVDGAQEFRSCRVKRWDCMSCAGHDCGASATARSHSLAARAATVRERFLE
jgi:hypothetical protein